MPQKINGSDCRDSRSQLKYCSVYMDALRACSQSQPKCTDRRIDAMEPGYSEPDDLIHIPTSEDISHVIRSIEETEE